MRVSCVAAVALDLADYPDPRSARTEIDLITKLWTTYRDPVDTGSF
jgi:hypothetical protein